MKTDCIIVPALCRDKFSIAIVAGPNNGAVAISQRRELIHRCRDMVVLARCDLPTLISAIQTILNTGPDGETVDDIKVPVSLPIDDGDYDITIYVSTSCGGIFIEQKNYPGNLSTGSIVLRRDDTPKLIAALQQKL